MWVLTVFEVNGKCREGIKCLETCDTLKEVLNDEDQEFDDKQK